MIQKRIIPVLLLSDRGLVKSVKFKDYTYIGDPINAVRIFNDKEVDELVFLDIRASKNKQKPDFNYLQEIASECFIPFGYGGGLKTMQDIKQAFLAGAEKVILNTSILSDLNLLSQAANEYGNQSIVASIDYKINLFGGRKVYSHADGKLQSIDPLSLAEKVQDAGAGEIIINSVDRDGTLSGYDTAFLDELSKKLSVPLVACGGAKDYSEMYSLLNNTEVAAAAAGSVFVYRGKLKAVLINYPKREELDSQLAVKI